MGCSRPMHVPCPQGGLETSSCFGCYYHIYNSSGAGYVIVSAAKTVDQFTTEELLAEIRRRIP